MPICYLDIAIPGPFPKPLTYALTSEMLVPPPGCRVEVPLGNRTVIGVSATLNHNLEYDPKKVKPITRVIDNTPVFDTDVLSMCQWAARYYHQNIGEVLYAALPKLLRDGLAPTVKQEPCWQLTTFGKGLSEKSLKRAPKQQQCIQLLQQHGQLTNKSLKHYGIGSAITKALQGKKLIELAEKVPLKTQSSGKTLALNDQQKAASDRIVEQNDCHLLFGITGSGKTEVYLSAIQHFLSIDQQVLVILPEINLTPQFVQRFEERLGLTVEALHSGMTDRQRLNIWLNAKMGHTKIIIGTRSALFTPFKSLGLIVVDEEHSQSLKQQESVRYSARDLAVWRAKHLGIGCVLGSATPSLESYVNARQNRYSLIELNQRAKASTLPSWHMIDIRNQALHSGLSKEVLDTAATSLNRGEHVLFFINRLGYAPNIICQSCGWHAQCHSCDANLRVFLNKRLLRCGQCDAQQALPTVCPSCGHPHLHTTGQGTEQLEHYLESYFDYPVIRIDSETSGRQNQLKHNLQRLQTEESCIIIGTQMMAKGHDFNKLNLVVVVNADESLMSGDYRATEGTAQLLTQVAGRAGRSGVTGKVLVQTFYPQHPLFTLLANNDYHAFLEQERATRQAIALPPYCYDALVLVTSQSPNLAQTTLQNLVESYQWHCTVIGPQPAVMARKAGWFRSTLTLRSPDRKVLHQHIATTRQWLASNKHHKVRWSIDVDPLVSP